MVFEVEAVGLVESVELAEVVAVGLAELVGLAVEVLDWLFYFESEQVVVAELVEAVLIVLEMVHLRRRLLQ